MLPTVDAVYSAAKAVFLPPLRYGLRWTIEGAAHIPERGATIVASNHISYLDPLTLAFVANQRGRRVRFLAKSELFENRMLGPLLHAAHQIPVYRGTAESSGALSAAIEALARGECVAVFPEGTISQDFEPMRGKSGTARLALASGAAVVPVGLWGTHRILTKGRKPHPAYGVAEVAVVGEPIVIDEHARAVEGTHRIMDAITACVARAREIYPQRPAADDDWWWRAPESAAAHRAEASEREA
jgi:1-acyl-sn-glycerol-3-phosphate acyltransferase